jgi:hypothetical protein
LKEVPPGKLHSDLGVRDVRHVQGRHALAVTEEVLA